MGVLLAAALDPLRGSESGGGFPREPPAKGSPKSLSLSHWAEARGLGTFDCKDFLLTASYWTAACMQ